MADNEDHTMQAKIFQALSSELRLQLLERVTQGPISAPDLEDDFEVTSETIVNNLNKLENVGLLTSKTVRGPGNRPRKEFTLRGDGVRLELEVVADDYYFEFGEPHVFTE